jgi:hypothetical protein
MSVCLVQQAYVGRDFRAMKDGIDGGVASLSYA